MEACAATLPLDVYPVLTVGESGSTSLDEIVNLLAQNGRTVAEAVGMVVPPAKRIEAREEGIGNREEGIAKRG